METNILKMITIADLASLANALCGILAIIAVLNGQNIISAELLLAAVFFDSVDGILARRFKSHTGFDLFGENIDSLADVISFGVAPAIILYMITTGSWIIIPAALIVVCGILRLTRYNTISAVQEGPVEEFLGLPIPVTSTILAALMLIPQTNIYLLAILAVIISILMVSEIKYPKLKNRNEILAAAVLIILCIIPGANTLLFNIPAYLLAAGVLIYIIAVPLISLDRTRQLINILSGKIREKI